MMPDRFPVDPCAPASPITAVVDEPKPTARSIPDEGLPVIDTAGLRPRRIRIRSGGSFMSSSVTVVDEDGNEDFLTDVLSADWSLAQGDFGRVTLVIASPEIDVIGEEQA